LTYNENERLQKTGSCTYRSTPPLPAFEPGMRPARRDQRVSCDIPARVARRDTAC
jgi:hypothetical protein